VPESIEEGHVEASGKPRRRGLSALRTERWQLIASSAMHVVNDGLFAGTYPLLPLVAAELGLSYAQVGAIKTAFSGSSSVLQVPAGLVAERMGEQLLMALGTGWVGLGLVGLALAGSYLPLLVLSVLAGIGGNVQHPVASAVVSRLYESKRRATAIGTLNFAGDIGKVLAPIVVGVASAIAGWRAGFAVLGVIGAVFGLLYLVVVPEPRDEPVETKPATDAKERAAPSAAVLPTRGLWARWGISAPGTFLALVLVGMLDSAARGAALVFIPFVLQQKGAEAASMSFYFSMLFAAGAAGKFICGPLADRFGNVGTIAITELVTAAALLGVLWSPLGWTLLALLPLGFMLNGTSSVLYASVASLVHSSRRARGYGLYYTASLLASAAAPVAYGALADQAGLGPAMVTLAAVTAGIVPVVLTVGRGLASRN
jgi:MFS transporter, FSR family, fosmidomycin resistance protein